MDSKNVGKIGDMAKIGIDDYGWIAPTMSDMM
jgi:hypothetical protein